MQQEVRNGGGMSGGGAAVASPLNGSGIYADGGHGVRWKAERTDRTGDPDGDGHRKSAPLTLHDELTPPPLVDPRYLTSPLHWQSLNVAFKSGMDDY